VGWAAYQTMVGSIFAQTPRPIIREKHPVLANTAKQLTQIANDGLREMGSRYVTRACIQDVFWAGFGIAMMRLDQDIEDGSPKNQRYSLNRVHPNSFGNDTKSVMPSQEDALWSFIEFYPTIKDLKDDPDYGSLTQQAIDGMQRLNGPPQSEAAQKSRGSWSNQAPNGGEDSEVDEFATVRIQEVWDKVSKRILYIPTGTDFVIGEKDWPVSPMYNGKLLFPWTVLYFNENPDEFWPIPEMSMIADEIDQLSVLDRQSMLDAVTKFRKFVVLGKALQKGTHANLLAGGGSGILLVDDNFIGDPSKFNISNIVAPVPDPAVKQDILAFAAYKKNQIHETVGAGDFASAGMRSTRSATEAAALSDFLRVRMTTRTENLDAFFQNVTKLYVLFLQETATEQRYVQTTDVQGIQQWQQFDAQGIKGDFDFEIIAGSSMPKNTDSARERNMALFQQVAPLLQQSGGNLRPWIDWIAPFFDIPQHLLDQSFSNHTQALQQLAVAFLAAHQGVAVDPNKFMELVAQAVNTGMSPADLQKATQAATQAAAAQGPTAPGAQPVSLPGTNTSDQTQ
jgi:hypothetical protein